MNARNAGKPSARMYILLSTRGFILEKNHMSVKCVGKPSARLPQRAHTGEKNL